MTPPHIARAQAVQSYLSSVAPSLERLGATVVLDIIEDRTLAAVSMSVTFTGSLDMANQLAHRIERGARAQGFALRSIIVGQLPEALWPEDLHPGEQRVGFVSLCSRQKAAA